MIKFSDMTTCPQCGEYLKKDRDKCPYCGYVIVERLAPEVELFSSEKRAATNAGYTQQSKSELPKATYQGASADSASDDVFSSSSRSAANGGYTQQHAQAKEGKYYGISAENVSNMNDGTFFRSNRERAVSAEPIKRAVMPDENVFFSSEKSTQAHKANAAVTNAAPDHDPKNNPYSGKSVLTEKPEITEHSFEYKANNLREFTKHRFSKEIVDRIELILGLLLSTAFLCVIFEQVFVAPYLSILVWYVTVGYTAVMFVLGLVAIRIWRKEVSLTIAYLTIIYSLFMLLYIFIVGVTNSIYDIDLFIMFIPIAAANVLCLRLTKRMYQLHELWDAYGKRGEELVHVEDDDEYEIYHSETNSEESKEENSEEE